MNTLERSSEHIKVKNHIKDERMIITGSGTSFFYSVYTRNESGVLQKS